MSRARAPTARFGGRRHRRRWRRRRRRQAAAGRRQRKLSFSLPQPHLGARAVARAPDRHDRAPARLELVAHAPQRRVEVVLLAAARGGVDAHVLQVDAGHRHRGLQVGGRHACLGCRCRCWARCCCCCRLGRAGARAHSGVSLCCWRRRKGPPRRCCCGRKRNQRPPRTCVSRLLGRARNLKGAPLIPIELGPAQLWGFTGGGGAFCFSGGGGRRAVCLHRRRRKRTGALASLRAPPPPARRKLASKRP